MDSLQGRTCGTDTSRCTACCKTHPLDLDDGFVKAPARWCPSCQKGGGCMVYGQDARPPVCVTFRCDWLKGMGGTGDRPDQTKVILESQTGTLGGDVLVMWEVAEGALQHTYAVTVLDNAIAEGKPVLAIYCNGSRIFYLPKRLADAGVVDCGPIADLGIRVEIAISLRNISVPVYV